MINNEKTRSHLKLFLVVAFLASLAALPRFVNLGALGFYGDEETTALPARSLASGQGARMPSGMPYRRALPQTWANAVSARMFGLDRELSYRVPAALLGTLTVPMLFLLGRSKLGVSTAFVAAMFLAVSEWHIVTSREARMYAPFLFFYLGAVFAMWAWATSAKYRYLVLATILFGMTVALHQLGVLAALLTVIPIALVGWQRVSSTALLAFTALAIVSAQAYARYFVNKPFTEWVSMDWASELPAKVTSLSWWPEHLAFMPNWVSILAIAGAAAGFTIAYYATCSDAAPRGRSLRTLGRYVTATLFGALGGIGQIYGAGIFALLFLFLCPGSRLSLLTQTRYPLAVVVVLALGWGVATALDFGPAPGFKSLLAFPFPYPAFFATMFPGVFIMFAGVTIYLALKSPRPEEYVLRTCILAALIPIVVIGLVSRWGGIRYLIAAYPFVLLGAAWGLVRIVSAAVQRFNSLTERSVPMIATVVILSGVLGGHGLVQANKTTTLEYGEPVEKLVLGFPFYPDHKTPGAFVENIRLPGDIVIAEDPLEQFWYAGQVDYWLRDFNSHRHFLYRAKDSQARDIYVSSVLLRDEHIQALIKQASGRIWLITSGETQHRRDLYLSSEQRLWLEAVEASKTPMFTGQDGVTKVYCLNCETKISKP